MKPLEFKIEEKYDYEDKKHTPYRMIFYYENKEEEYLSITNIPKGLELNKHYSIADLYGYKVVDDREGL